MPNNSITSKLTGDGDRVLKVLETKYGMTRDNAIKLMKDGGALLSVALIRLSRGTL